MSLDRTYKFSQVAFAFFGGATGELPPPLVLEAAEKITGRTPTNLPHALDLLEEVFNDMIKEIRS